MPKAWFMQLDNPRFIEFIRETKNFKKSSRISPLTRTLKKISQPIKYLIFTKHSTEHFIISLFHYISILWALHYIHKPNAFHLLQSSHSSERWFVQSSRRHFSCNLKTQKLLQSMFLLRSERIHKQHGFYLPGIYLSFSSKTRGLKEFLHKSLLDSRALEYFVSKINETQ